MQFSFDYTTKTLASVLARLAELTVYLFKSCMCACVLTRLV